MDPTPREDRRDRRNLFLYAIIAGFVLMAVVLAGPPLASKLFPSNGVGDPSIEKPVEQRTK
jgi:hypothetical protein